MLKIAIVLLLSLPAGQNSYAQEQGGKYGGLVPVLNSMASFLPRPEYPQQAKDRCAGGRVDVEVLIDENGDVTSAAAVSGDPTLRDSAVEAAKKAKFRIPASVRWWGYVVYNFDSLRTCQTPQKTVGIMLGRLNEKARILPMPRVPERTDIGISGSVTVIVKVDIQRGTVISVKAMSGHPLLRKPGEAAAMGAKFEPALKELPAVYGTGFIIYSLDDVNGEMRVNNKPGVSVIVVKGALNGKATLLRKPQGVRVGNKFITGRVEVAVLIAGTGGGVIAAHAFSGPSELRAVSEKAALDMMFSSGCIDGAGAVYVTGSVVYVFAKNGQVK
jgi:TonB family protein